MANPIEVEAVGEVIVGQVGHIQHLSTDYMLQNVIQPKTIASFILHKKSNPGRPEGQD